MKYRTEYNFVNTVHMFQNNYTVKHVSVSCTSYFIINNAMLHNYNLIYHMCRRIRSLRLAAEHVTEVV